MRILCLGDSFTHARPVREGETFWSVLEGRTRAALPGAPVDVVNLSLDGYSTGPAGSGGRREETPMKRAARRGTMAPGGSMANREGRARRAGGLSGTWTLATRLGRFRLTVSGGRIVALRQAAGRGARAPLPDIARRVREDLERLAVGRPVRRSHPLAPRGTPFQRRVWGVLRAIPRGSVLTYAQVARRAGRPPTAARAVGQACKANPIAILIPCHRIVGGGGALGGYAGRWNAPRKARLLALEGVSARDRALRAARIAGTSS